MSIAVEDAVTEHAHILEEQDLRRIDAYWRAANYLSVGQIYLLDNPLLRAPLRPEHTKPRLRALGYQPWPQLHLRAPQSNH
jgi:xylulose-5-phosphate/fructose-6-phosphate phosphoketolase